MQKQRQLVGDSLLAAGGPCFKDRQYEAQAGSCSLTTTSERPLWKKYELSTHMLQRQSDNHMMWIVEVEVTDEDVHRVRELERPFVANKAVNLQNMNCRKTTYDNRAQGRKTKYDFTRLKSSWSEFVNFQNFVSICLLKAVTCDATLVCHHYAIL